MHSETFFNTYLELENPKDILDAQYYCVSLHIRRNDTSVNNVVCDMAMLYPNNSVLCKGTELEMKYAYEDQLKEDEPRSLIARFINLSMNKNYNIVLMCTKKEWKHLKYLRWLAEFVYCDFGYPIYQYQYFVDGGDLFLYDKKKVNKYIQKIIKESDRKSYEINSKSKLGRRRLMQEYQSLKKKELEKILKEKGMYSKDMTKADMLETLEVFM